MLYDILLNEDVKNNLTDKDTCAFCNEKLILDPRPISSPVSQIYCPNRYQGREHTWIHILTRKYGEVK
jgi:hypothetical protein